MYPKTLAVHRVLSRYHPIAAIVESDSDDTDDGITIRDNIEVQVGYDCAIATRVLDSGIFRFMPPRRISPPGLVLLLQDIDKLILYEE